jgi:diguanylate cyclase (GGDEF)-like protein/PAS domain S-box-containing protein
VWSLPDEVVEGSSLKPLQILVVDDDDVDRERVVRFVDQSPLIASMTQATSVKHAVSLLRANLYDCVVLDNQLPDGTGVELLPLLRETSNRPCPVIMVTGAGDEELAAHVMRGGAADYLSKSRLSTDTLYRSIARCVESCRMQEKLDQYANDLAASEAKYRAMVEDQSEMVSLVHPDLTFVYVNKAYATHYGLTPDQLVGRTLLEFVPVDEREVVASQMLAVCNSRSVEDSLNRTMSAIANVSRWVSWTNRAIVDNSGDVVSIHSVGRDVTDQIQGRAAVSRLAAVVNASVDAIISTDLHGEITSWNPAAEQLFGYPMRVAIGTSIDLIVPPDHLIEERMLAQRVSTGESISEFQTVRARGDASLIDVAISLSPIRDGQDDVIGISKVVRDIGERKRLERALHANERQFRELYQATPAMLHSIDAGGRLLSVSDTWLIRLGFVRSEVIGRAFIGFLAPGSRKHIHEHVMPDLLRTGVCEEVECCMVCCNGRLIDVLMSATLERDESGNPWRSLAVLQDVTEKNRLAKDLAEEHARLRVTLRSIGDAVITTDRDGRVEFLNPVAETLTGWTGEEARGKPIEQVFHIVNEESRRTTENPVAMSLVQNRAVGLPDRSLLIARDGNEYAIEDSSAPIRDLEGNSLGAVLVFHDVTSQRRMTVEMNFRATHDALTGLLNRGEFEDRLKRALSRIKASTGEFAVLYIDLDQFKLVNDACGHSVGDLLLRQIGGVLQRCVRTRDTLARLGGDEFAIILEHCSVEQAKHVAQQICDRIEEFRFVHDQRRFRLGASIGLVAADAHWPNEAALLQAADACCYAAKEAGRNRVHTWFETDNMMRLHHGEAQWASRIESALDDGRFVLYAQRIAPLKEPERGLHCEVLVRMLDIDGTLVLPGAILPAAERFHMAPRIDRWVIRAVFEWMLRNQSLLGAVDLIAVNLSGQSLGDRSFHRHVEELIAAINIDVRKLCFEVTETTAITNLNDASVFISRMRELGVRIALDDFGAGASSFGYLKSLPVDFLKIDGQFIRNIVNDPLDDVAVRCFRDVAAVLGVKTVAEFVEDEDIRSRLIEIGIDFGQGYAFHRPEPLDALVASITAIN